jgi:hypothetical protein
MKEAGKYEFQFYKSEDAVLKKASEEDSNRNYPLLITVAAGGSLLLMFFILCLLIPLIKLCRKNEGADIDARKVETTDHDVDSMMNEGTNIIN